MFQALLVLAPKLNENLRLGDITRSPRNFVGTESFDVFVEHLLPYPKAETNILQMMIAICGMTSGLKAVRDGDF